jgi:hypothetical protein
LSLADFATVGVAGKGDEEKTWSNPVSSLLVPVKELS